jgi:hypothetical protein
VAIVESVENRLLLPEVAISKRAAHLFDCTGRRLSL